MKKYLFVLFLLFCFLLFAGQLVIADNYYVDPFPKSKMSSLLVFEESSSCSGIVIGEVKRIVQFGDTAIVLSHFTDIENNTYAHLKLFAVEKGVNRYLSTDGIIDSDNTTSNVYRRISDIARTSDSKLVACNYVLTHMPDADIAEGYESGAFCVWRWENLDKSPIKWFRSETGAYFGTVTENGEKKRKGKANIGESMVVNGTIDNCNIYVTAVDAQNSNSSLRIAKFNVDRAGNITSSGDIGGGEVLVGLTGFSQMYQQGTGNILLSTEILGYAPYTLSLSPRSEENVIFSGPNFSFKEFYCVDGPTAPVVAKDAFTAAGYIYDKNLTNASYFNYGSKSFMVMPYINGEHQVLGVKIYDITTGLASPTLLSTINLATPASVVYASADMVLDGNDINVYLHTVSKSAVGGESTVTIYKFTNAESATLFKPRYTRPIELKNTNCVVRIAEEEVKNTLPTMTIDFLAGDYTSLDGFGDICLYATDDVDYEQKAQNLTHVYTLMNPMQGSDCSLIPIDSDFVMKPGKRYSFCSSYVSLKAFCFDVCVVPNIVVWSPSVSTEWYLDANWKTLSGEKAYTPLAQTNVIISENELATLYKPDIDILSNLKYEIGYVVNQCKDIYFAPNSRLLNHHCLIYDRAYIDVPFGNNNGSFELKSVPLNGVVSGDFYIPKEGDSKTFDFVDLANVDTRVANKFKQKTFNASVVQSVGAVKDTVVCEASTWSEPTNMLNMPWQVGRGYAIAKQTRTEQNYVRLPKAADEYYPFYDNNGQEGEIKVDWAKVHIDRGDNANKLAYSGGDYNVTLTNDVPSDIFLVGNPFMCDMYIDVFLKENVHIEKTFYYTFNNDILNVEFIDNDGVYAKIAPMEAFFVKTYTPSKTLDIVFTDEMMWFDPLIAPIDFQSSRKKDVDEELTITAKRNDKTSKTVIKLSSTATTRYTTAEDAPLLLLDSEFTPFAIYSIADNHAVAYNVVNDIYMIPLSVNIIDGEEMGDITFEFTGVDNLSQFIYLYDSYDDRYVSLAEGDVFNYDVDENQPVRYYVTSRRASDITTKLDESKIEKVKIFNSGEGNLLIYASEDILTLNIYDLIGKLIISEENINMPQYNIVLPQHNVYMFEIVTKTTVSKQKVAVK